MRRMTWALAAALALTALGGLLASPALHVREVRVRGVAGLTQDETEATRLAAEVPPGTNVLRGGWDRTTAALSRLPWVKTVRARRALPAGVEFMLIPRMPVSVLLTATGGWEVDDGGMVIRPARPDLRLPTITALDAAPEAGQPADFPGVAGALAALSMLQSGKQLPITKIEVDSKGELCLNMVDSVAIRLGQPDGLNEKVALVRRIYSERPDIASTAETVDLRDPAAPYCVLRGAKGETKPGERGEPLDTLLHGRPHGPSSEAAEKPVEER
jgi:cell division protein FtsQ